ncbi:hypothetical protein [Vagococcus salmoninarum]|uniref:hypothetical protein n=1 Tax=Vagococcus salmoninarum TaxID=2739 RepID=UPI003F96459C
MTYELSQDQVKKELSVALSTYTQLLRNVDFIASEDIPAFTFTMRSFGFIFERIPHLLITDDIEEAYFGIFQYYNLLEELKNNLTMAFPYAKLQNQPLLTALKPFPKSHEDLINQWWEDKTGLKVEFTKQTITR